MLMRFFTGMSLMGYVVSALAAVLLLSWSGMFFMSKRISSLHEDIGAYEVTVNRLVDANFSTRESLDTVEVLLKQCADKRTEAEARADEARKDISTKTKEAYIASDERRDTLEDAITIQEPKCTPPTLPSRATELLLEAARSANRGSDSP